jgi:spermidine synthase
MIGLECEMGKRLILKNKYYLYMTEFFAGMSVMAVELGASRLLAPYFSSSQIVWTIIIGTIMIALALGNIWGGRSADKDPNPDKLYYRILIAAVWIAAIPVLGKYIILLISGLLVLTVNNNLLILAAFLACMVIFVYPLLLLGTVTPSLAKYCMDSLDDNGKTVGTLGAFNTVGSILGTFLPTFVTIPTVGTAITFLIFSGILLLIGLIYFISARTKKTAGIITGILFVACTLLGNSDSFAFWENDLLYEGESIYNYLQVKDTGDSVVLSTNVLFGVQSIMMKEDGLTGMYYDYALAALVMADAENQGPDVLVLGMGTGTYARQCQTYFPNASIKGVEIDQKITDLSADYFKLPENIEVITYDGRAYLAAQNNRYDVIFVDAYQDITIPFQMSSVEFFNLVKDHLTENGVMVVNMNMHADGDGSINAYLADTIASVFDNVYTVDVPNTTNRELFAGAGTDLSTTLSSNVSAVEDSDLRSLMSSVSKELTVYQKGSYLLTDDKAPVELLGMRMVDRLIQDELGSYKQEFRGMGIGEMLKNLS